MSIFTRSKKGRCFVLLFFFLVFICPFAVTAQSVLNPNDTIVEYNSAAPPATPPYNTPGKWVRTKKLAWNTNAYKAYYLNGYSFRLKFPKTYVPGVADGKLYPLVVIFHGKSEGGPVYDNESQLFNGGQAYLNAVNNEVFDGYVLFMQNPQSAWSTPQFSIVNKIIDYMVANNKLDIDRVTIQGISAGGIGTWNYLSAYIKNVAAAIPMSAASATNGANDAVENYKFTPLWLFQGGLDQNPKPSVTQVVVDSAKAKGANFRYTLYPNTGHNTWYEAYVEADYFPFINRAHKANPYALFGKVNYCEGDAINTIIGISAGFDAYEWRKNGAPIAGATTNSIVVNDVGSYTARFRRGSNWSVWSPIPVVIARVAKPAGPVITLASPQSTVIPSPDGKTAVNLTVAGDDNNTYSWYLSGNSTALQSGKNYTAATPGNYLASFVTPTGCVSQLSSPFRVVNANGVNKPDPATALQVATLSATAVQLQWSQTPAPAFEETGFEIYRGQASGGPYTYVGVTAANASVYTDTALVPGARYYYVVRAVNSSAAAAVSNEAAGQSVTDVTAPTAPGSLLVNGSTKSSISLRWTASTDNVGIDHYNIYEDGVKIDSTPAVMYTATGLAQNSSHTYYVVAVDAAGNISPNSNSVTGYAVGKGLKYKYYAGSFLKLPDFTALVPADSGQVNNVTLDNRLDDNNFAYLWEGFIWIPVSGTYTFRTNSDDGSKLYLSPYSFSATAIVNNDGIHGKQDRDTTLQMNAGIYPIAISYFNRTGGRSMLASWRTPQTSDAFTAIPDSVFTDFIPGAPLIQAASSFAVRVGESKTFSFTATDTNGEAITFTTSGLPSFGTLTSNSGTDGKIVFAPTAGSEGSYPFQLIATDASGNRTTADVVVVVGSAGGQFILINVNGTPESNEGSPYNNLAGTATAGKTLPLIDEFADSTTVKMTTVDTWVSPVFNNGGTGAGNGIRLFTDNVMATGIADYSAASRRIRFSGIAPGKKVTFYLYASRMSQNGIRKVDFTAGGRTASVEANNNKGYYVQLNEVAPEADSTITLVVSRGTGNTSALFLNAVAMLIANSDGKPTAPTRLSANAASRSKINLKWLDNAETETGYQVFRATAQGGPFTKIADLPANATAFADSTLTSNTAYFYKVLAVGVPVNSDYSNTVREVSLLYSIFVNFNQTDPAGSPWFNTNGVPQSGRIWSLRDDLGQNQNVQLKVNDAGFSGVNPNGANTGNNSGVYPDNVMRSSFWVDGGNQGTLNLTGLDTGNVYHLTLFSSRAGITGPRLTEFVVNGEIRTTLDAANNSTEVVKVLSVRPNAQGIISLVVKPGTGASYGYINALVIQATSANLQANTPPPAMVTPPSNSDPTRVDSLTTTFNTLSASPNPFRNEVILTVYSKNALDNPAVSVINFSGAVVYRQKLGQLIAGRNVIKLELGNRLTGNGLYFIQVTDNKGFKKLAKLIKQ